MRTEEKRSEIVQVAARLFEREGYDRTSMSMISEQLGGSKATLYGYFRSKEELLQAVLRYQVTTEADRIIGDFPAVEDLRTSLIRLATAYLTKRTSALPVANIRMVATQPPGSTLGKEFYETVLRPHFERMAKKFETLMDEGKIKRADPWIAFMHWKGLCDWDMFEKRLLGAIDGPDPKEIKTAATEAADAFLKLYGTNGHAGEKSVPKRQIQSKKALAKAVLTRRKS